MDMLNKDFRLKVRYKKRYPDPGLCAVVSMDWEKRTMQVTNGYIRLWPDFDEVEISEDLIGRILRFIKKAWKRHLKLLA